MAVRKKRTPWTADQWVKEWTTNPLFARPSQATNDTNAERVSKFGTDFKGLELAALTPQMAKDWAAENQGRAAAVRAMLNDAKEHGVIVYNPFSGTSAKASHRPPARLTAEEIGVLAATGYELFPDWPVMGSLIVTAAYTGMGLGELSALQWQNIDWEAGTISVERQYQPRQKKFATARYGKGRLIAMPDVVAQALRDLPRLGEDDLVFYARRTHGIYYSQLHTYFWLQVRAAFFAKLPAERQAEIGPALDFNDLRYFTAKFLTDHGVEPADAAYQLGVTTKRLLDMYDPVRDGAAERVRQAFRDSALRHAG